MKPSWAIWKWTNILESGTCNYQKLTLSQPCLCKVSMNGKISWFCLLLTSHIKQVIKSGQFSFIKHSQIHHLSPASSALALILPLKIYHLDSCSAPWLPHNFPWPIFRASVFNLLVTIHWRVIKLMPLLTVNVLKMKYNRIKWIE